MTRHESAPRKLELHRLPWAQAQARSSLAQRVRSLEIVWGEQSWRLTLTPSVVPGPLCAGETEWCVQVLWAGVPIDLVLPAGLVQAWLLAKWPELDAGEIPDSMAAVAMEEACEAMVSTVAGADLGPIRIDRLSRGPAEGAPMELAFDVQAVNAQSVLVGRLAVGPLGLSLLARLAAERPQVRNDLPSEDLPMAWRAHIGCTWLAVNEVARLSVGDSVLLEDSLIHDDGQLWIACGSLGLRAVMQGASLVVTTPFKAGGWTMQANGEEVVLSEGPDSIDQLPLRVTFDLGDLAMTLGQVRELQVGQSIDLGQPLTSAVRVRVNGLLIGLGELVDIDGRMGVTVTSLARRKTTDAPRMTLGQEAAPALDTESDVESL